MIGPLLFAVEQRKNHQLIILFAVTDKIRRTLHYPFSGARYTTWASNQGVAY